ncbi:uncharacterized protein CLUP02_11662 [Colletotrichum lupini]|uniref:DUF6594 domain-containing protein n=1 Tax=Colletotrichum lupini TaxID=145971 RepID=A0A9Q8T0U7_9PEZI|nr:uncharacterized protein CLUP02_11662 [Colletotrichum lupini]UQC86162.1 hypothetical protein CLUP02_11662 [Colletotrichum lupini]
MAARAQRRNGFLDMTGIEAMAWNQAKQDDTFNIGVIEQHSKVRLHLTRTSPWYGFRMIPTNVRIAYFSEKLRPDDTRTYNEEKISRYSDTILAALSAALPTLATLVLYFVQNMLHRIGLVIVLTMIFSFLFALLTRAKMAEIFAAAAAFGLWSPRTSIRLRVLEIEVIDSRKFIFCLYSNEPSISRNWCKNVSYRIRDIKWNALALFINFMRIVGGGSSRGSFVFGEFLPPRGIHAPSRDLLNFKQPVLIRSLAFEVSDSHVTHGVKLNHSSRPNFLSIKPFTNMTIQRRCNCNGGFTGSDTEQKDHDHPLMIDQQDKHLMQQITKPNIMPPQIPQHSRSDRSTRIAHHPIFPRNGPQKRHTLHTDSHRQRQETNLQKISISTTWAAPITSEARNLRSAPRLPILRPPQWKHGTDAPAVIGNLRSQLREPMTEPHLRFLLKAPVRWWVDPGTVYFTLKVLAFAAFIHRLADPYHKMFHITYTQPSTMASCVEPKESDHQCKFFFVLFPSPISSDYVMRVMCGWILNATIVGAEFFGYLVLSKSYIDERTTRTPRHVKRDAPSQTFNGFSLDLQAQ